MKLMIFSHALYTHMAHILQIPYLITDSVKGVHYNILVKLFALATRKNDHYFLKLNHRAETITLTSESV